MKGMALRKRDRRREPKLNVKVPILTNDRHTSCPSRMPGGQRTYRCLVPGRILFDSMASAAVSLRSKCGSERRPPECNKQRWPEATPHVGQGTEDNCSGVRSRILIDIECDMKSRNSIQFGTVLEISPRKLSTLPAGCRETARNSLNWRKIV